MKDMTKSEAMRYSQSPQDVRNLLVCVLPNGPQLSVIFFSIRGLGDAGRVVRARVDDLCAARAPHETQICASLAVHSTSLTNDVVGVDASLVSAEVRSFVVAGELPSSVCRDEG